MPPDPVYRTAEFAALAGVTVRALHHYDRLGLLRLKRTAAGYRLYTHRDLEVLEQIVALKFIGVPLRKISLVRRAGGAALAEVLRAQRQTLEEKRHGLTRAIDAIAAAETTLRAGRPANAPLFRAIIGAIEMQQDDREWTRQYRALLDAKIATLRAIPAETRLALKQQWLELVAEIWQNLGEDPAGPTAQALAGRWTALLREVSGAVDPEWKAFLAAPERKADAARFAATLGSEAAAAGGQYQPFVDAEVWAFVRRALAARG